MSASAYFKHSKWKRKRSTEPVASKSEPATKTESIFNSPTNRSSETIATEEHLTPSTQMESELRRSLYTESTQSSQDKDDDETILSHGLVKDEIVQQMQEELNLAHSQLQQEVKLRESLENRMIQESHEYQDRLQKECQMYNAMELELRETKRQMEASKLEIEETASKSFHWKLQHHTLKERYKTWYRELELWIEDAKAKKRCIQCKKPRDLGCPPSISERDLGTDSPATMSENFARTVKQANAVTPSEPRSKKEPGRESDGSTPRAKIHVNMMQDNDSQTQLNLFNSIPKTRNMDIDSPLEHAGHNSSNRTTYCAMEPLQDFTNQINPITPLDSRCRNHHFATAEKENRKPSITNKETAVNEFVLRLPMGDDESQTQIDHVQLATLAPTSPHADTDDQTESWGSTCRTSSKLSDGSELDSSSLSDKSQALLDPLENDTRRNNSIQLHSSVLKKVATRTPNTVPREFCLSTKESKQVSVHPDHTTSSLTCKVVAPQELVGQDHNSLNRTLPKQKVVSEPFAYHEVERRKAERQKMPGRACPECSAFWDTVCDNEAVYKRKHFEDCSRHRAYHSPPSTPDGFWDPYFTDEIKRPNGEL